MPLRFDASHSHALLPSDWLSARLDTLAQAQAQLETGSGKGGELTGWVNLPLCVDHAELLRIKAVAAQIRAQSDVLVVVGIGGSYLGSRAVLELLRSPQHNLTDRPQIFFAGSSLSSDAWDNLRTLLKNKNFSVNVVSKSGTTVETSAAFLLLREWMAERYSPEELRTRIFITTDPSSGALRELANSEGLASFSIPSNIGGRYSVLTPVGLLPLAVAGIDIDALLAGASQMRQELRRPGQDNPAWQYAAARHACLEMGLSVELLVSYEPYFRCFGEWWKQLFGESEGKCGRGLFPATAEFCADLHSMGQYIQDGSRVLFETIVLFDSPHSHTVLPDRVIPKHTPDILRGRAINDLAKQAFRGTLLAHVDGGVPNLLIQLSNRTADEVGQLIYFFQYACALGAYLLEVNPFDQPGVEAYKRNMLALLGQPGLEDERQALEARF